jgi:hypothetical protein
MKEKQKKALGHFIDLHANLKGLSKTLIRDYLFPLLAKECNNTTKMVLL